MLAGAPMWQAAAELAGFFTAHAIQSVADAAAGEPSFHPMLAIDADGTRQMRRFIVEDVASLVESTRADMEANTLMASAAALLYDGRLTLGDEKLDAVFVEFRSYGSPAVHGSIAVPYAPAQPGPMRVYRPKLLEVHGVTDTNAVFASFWHGVDRHVDGNKIWADHLDESK